jgi:hypothetical protein
MAMGLQATKKDGRIQPVKIYLAGNFPQMSKPQLEEVVLRRIISLGAQYLRLISFYYKDPWSNNVLTAVRAYETVSKERRLGLVRRRKKRARITIPTA